MYLRINDAMWRAHERVKRRRRLAEHAWRRFKKTDSPRSFATYREHFRVAHGETQAMQVFLRERSYWFNQYIEEALDG